MKGTGLLVGGLVLIVAGIAGLAVLNSGLVPLSTGANSPEERGAAIFETGTDPGTGPIPYSGGMMMRTSCAGCHGLDGRGLRTRMFVSPNITYRNLTDPAGMLEPDGTRGMRFTDELIRRAVTQGLDAEGKPLAFPMPRWQLTDAQWNDLLAYLKTLP
jgi:mono/diheme cytochrome c family protein